MPAKDLFEYAVPRMVPRVEREEFLNGGVVLCRSQGFLQTRFALPEALLRAFAARLDWTTWRRACTPSSAFARAALPGALSAN